MKRLMIMMLVAMLVFVGCSVDPTKEYTQALDKSFGTLSGKMEVKFSMTAEGESIVSTTSVQFQSESVDAPPMLKMYGHTETKDYGYDSLSYYADRKVYIEIPMIGKVIIVNTDDVEEKSTSTANIEKFGDIGSKIRTALDSDNVVAIEDTLVETLEGKVKAKRFSVDLDKVKVEELYEVAKEFSDMYDINVTLGDIESISSEAFIDFDGYLVRQTFTIGFVDADPITVDIKWWDFGRNQNIVVPDYDPSMIIDDFDSIEDMDFGGSND